MKFSEIYKNSPEKFANTQITGVYCDSRKVTKNSVFVCINGSAMDGHKFADKAAAAGAAVIVCEKDLGLDNQMIVDDSRVVYAAM